MHSPLAHAHTRLAVCVSAIRIPFGCGCGCINPMLWKFFSLFPLNAFIFWSSELVCCFVDAVVFC